MLVDSHCHLDRLDLSRYEDGLDGAIAAAKEQGVKTMLCVCISEENKQQVVDIASKYEGLFCSVGTHPSDVTSEVVSVETLVEWAKAPKVVALGESGLDYYYSKDYADIQKQSFANHLIAGAQLDLPVIVHTRDARQDTLDLIKEYGSTESAGVLHCFTENWEMAKAAMDLNYYISISGIVTFRNAESLRDVVKKMPLDRLLVETDSPYLAPVPFRGKPNEPRYVREVAQFVADLKGISLESLAEITTNNFHTLFKRTK
ncbi:TatD family hydrolase [Saccharophagus degradans]|uniref:TatD-related deoxyribonuclease n=1 Tax=Saccharophagus degradans (strain 2-40 / ATCC 43961 / DSM 17024) TaxID=203122 RepID=Q21K65_SACD2|nr:TatD family hydrolase [Saccharophagus degradans]ABD80914.1 TatD-related deoxyribonuclease [Saccharophagus degradans 2-40]